LETNQDAALIECLILFIHSQAIRAADSVGIVSDSFDAIEKNKRATSTGGRLHVVSANVVDE
jgi:hypothetical protein